MGGRVFSPSVWVVDVFSSWDQLQAYVKQINYVRFTKVLEIVQICKKTCNLIGIRSLIHSYKIDPQRCSNLLGADQKSNFN